MSAQPRESRKNVQVKVRLPKATHHVLSAIAEQHGVSLTKVIRAALALFVDDAKKAEDET